MNDTLTGLVEIIIQLNDRLRAAAAEIERLKKALKEETCQDQAQS